MFFYIPWKYQKTEGVVILSERLEVKLFNRSRPNPGQREKIRLNFYFHISLVVIKALKVFMKPFEAPQRSVKIKNLTKFLFQYNFQKCTGH